MSKFGEAIQESMQKPKVRTSSDFLKVNEDHQVIIRILDEKPHVSWSHWVPKGHPEFGSANGGRGISVMCPGINECPICKYSAEIKAEDPKSPKIIKARKVFTTNVLDRTPVIKCPKCKLEHYRHKNKWPTECSECGEDLSSLEAEPREKVQILQKGIKVFGQFETFENDPDFGDVREYDIKVDVRGRGSDAITTCTPKQKSKLDLDSILTEENKLYDIGDVVKPLEPEKIERIIEGESYFDVIKD